MTNKELIKRLLEFPMDAEIDFSMNPGNPQIIAIHNWTPKNLTIVLSIEKNTDETNT